MPEYQVERAPNHELIERPRRLLRWRRLSTVFVFGVVIVFVLALTAKTSSTSEAQTVLRPAEEAINWGKDHFPYPDWVLAVTETVDDVTSTWQQAKTLIRWRWQFQSKNLKPEEVSKFVDDKWLDSILTSYKSPKILSRCIVDKYTVIDATGKLEGEIAGDYRIHYYVWSDDKGFKDAFMVFDTARINTLDLTAKQFFGNAYQCPPGTGAPAATAAK